jgi:short-subunit dehydrogenase
LITGASSGIGRAFAEALAPRARRLTLTARREERLKDLAAALERRCDLRCVVAVADLAATDGPSRLVTSLRDGAAPPVDLLVNNAGFGKHGAFGSRSWEEWRAMFQVNMIAAAELLFRLWDDLRATPGRGAINVASAAGFQPMPWFAGYAATKAFLRSLSLALNKEARRTGTRILSLCPGPTRTEFGRIAGSSSRSGGPSMTAERVASIALGAYERGRSEVVPGALNRLGAAIAPRAPLRLVVAGAGLIGRRAAPDEFLG